MPRGQLTAKEKAAMQKARVETKQARAAALECLRSNAQFVNPKFWKAVDAELAEAVLDAIRKAEDTRRKKRIAQLKAELAELEKV